MGSIPIHDTMAMERVVAEKQKKMGIMESSDGVHMFCSVDGN